MYRSPDPSDFFFSRSEGLARETNFLLQRGRAKYRCMVQLKSGQIVGGGPDPLGDTPLWICPHQPAILCVAVSSQVVLGGGGLATTAETVLFALFVAVEVLFPPPAFPFLLGIFDFVA